MKELNLKKILEACHIIDAAEESKELENIVRWVYKREHPEDSNRDFIFTGINIYSEDTLEVTLSYPDFEYFTSIDLTEKDFEMTEKEHLEAIRAAKEEYSRRIEEIEQEQKQSREKEYQEFLQLKEKLKDKEIEPIERFISLKKKFQKDF